jgi:inner membrane protein
VSPVTHLLASWVVAAKTAGNLRDVRLITLAGIAPDLDGAGLLVDMARNAFTGGEHYPLYQHYHHYLLHGVAGGAVVAVLLAAFAKQRWKVLLLALGVFHLHLLCDFVGSRGPSPEDLWPIFYLGPFDKDPMWIWKGQWRLDGWQNLLISLGVFVWAMATTLREGHSVVGVFSHRFDVHFVRVIREWTEKLKSRTAPPV